MLCMQVETIGDAYMVVSGAPVPTDQHASHIADMALDMVNSMSDLTDPTSDGQRNIRIRIGWNQNRTIYDGVENYAFIIL